MDTVITTLVDYTVVPLTAPLPWLVSHGVLLLVFATIWAVFGLALVRDRARLDRAWARLRRTPLVVQGIAWLLFMPPLLGLWAWRTKWPVVTRVMFIVGLAAWNLLVFIPQAA